MDQISICSSQFQAVTASPIHMLADGEGISLWVLGVLVTLKVLANETGGTYALWEDLVYPGDGPPPHIHTQEDETWYMLEGELMWIVAGKEYHAKRGSFIHLPRFVQHGFVNRFDKPARMVLTYTPGGFEKWFIENGKPVTDLKGSPPEPTEEETEKALRLGREYGVIFAGDIVEGDQTLTGTL